MSRGARVGYGAHPDSIQVGGASNLRAVNASQISAVRSSLLVGAEPICEDIKVGKSCSSSEHAERASET